MEDLLEKKQVRTVNRNWINITADTFCIHGDHKNVLENLVLLLRLYKNYLKKGE